MISNNTFKDYVLSKDIKVVDEFSTYESNKDIDEKALEKQLMLISNFHNLIKGNTGPIKDRLDSCIGKVVENYKMGIKKLNRDIERFESMKNEKEQLSEVENIILNQGQKYIDKGNKCIKHIYKHKYYDLIIRSMENREICLGNVSFKNLIKMDKIMIKRIDKCAYNMVEMDCFNLLYKYKKKGYKVDYKKLISKFCKFERLDNNSFEYIKALLVYPYEVIRECNKYRKGKEQSTEEKYLLKMKKAINIENKKLITL